ncbi:MAG TPA: amino acid permease [Gemmatimonadales bacterium]|nr:amino acid permease [Gemmatimonadales bacterium]
MTSPAPTEPGLRRVIGMRGLAAAIFNITIGAAIFVLPAHMAAGLGAAAPLAYLVCAVATALVALCIAEAGSRVPQSGGPYAYVGTALGPYAGFLCGVLLWLGITLAMGAVATVFADAALGLVPGLGGALPRAVLLIVVYGGLAVVNIRGAALGSQVSGIATVAKIVPLIAFVGLGLSHVRTENLAPGSFPSLSRLGQSGLLLMFAFFGMESALQVSGEVRDGARAVPRAIALAVTGVGVLYIAVQLVAQGILGSALAAPETAKAPLAAAAVQFAGPTGATLILIAMIVSTFGFMTATMLATPRTLFAFAVDGYLPRPLARVHPAHHTPHVAIAVQGVIVCAIAITGTYVKLAIMADVAILLVYLACCLGVWRLRRLDAGAAAKPFVMPAGRVLPWVAAGLIVALLARATIQAWMLTGGVMAAASVAFLMNDVRKRRRTES